MTIELDVPRARFPIFLSALRAAASRPALWLLVWLVPLVVSAAVALPWVAWLGDALEHRYPPSAADVVPGEEVVPGAQLGYLDEAFRQDHRDALAGLRTTTSAAWAALALFAMLFGAFAAGGWLQVFLDRARGHGLRRFLWGGSRHFWRFVRVWLLTVVVLAGLAWLTTGWPWRTLVAGFLFGAPGGETEVLESEWTAVWLGWLQAGVAALLFALAVTWADYTRTRLALLDTRSALWAGLGTAGLLLRHPIRALRPMALLLGAEVLVLWLAGVLSWPLNAGLADGGSWRQVLGLLVVGQLALLWRAVVRGARYHAAIQVSRELVPPLARPDPWSRRVGGPGGPQYPIDPSDDYGVSL